MPVVGNVLAKRVCNTFPRILNWEAARSYTEDAVVHLLKDMDEVYLILYVEYL